MRCLSNLHVELNDVSVNELIWKFNKLVVKINFVIKQVNAFEGVIYLET
jgi:hypothetical protein